MGSFPETYNDPKQQPYTVYSLLTDTSLKQTLRVGPYLSVLVLIDSL